MMERFKKFLCVSSESGRLEKEEFLLDWVSWTDLEEIENFCDYDGIVINLTAGAEVGGEPLFSPEEILSVFSEDAWKKVLVAGGMIIVVGDPGLTVCAMGFGSSTVSPLTFVVDVAKDNRPLDYRRLASRDKSICSGIVEYLDEVEEWEYSTSGVRFSGPLDSALKGHGVQVEWRAVGTTRYQTWLASCCLVNAGAGLKPGVVILPPSGLGPRDEDGLVLKLFFGIEVSSSEPEWVKGLRLPGQAEIEGSISEKIVNEKRIEREIADERTRLAECKRWYRLLYEDGPNLELAVKESLELLGAKVTKKAIEKEDYRLEVRGAPVGVMEVKGTKKPQFGVGALGQLSRWMDLVTAEEGIPVKGVFVGNASRKEKPGDRDGLFAPNGERFAEVKEMAVLRSLDLLCLVILKQVGKIDLGVFWSELYCCKGVFDAGKYHEMLPGEYRWLVGG